MFSVSQHIKDAALIELGADPIQAGSTPAASVLNLLSPAGPKARSMKARGNAPGENEKDEPAPKGRPIGLRLGRPFRASPTRAGNPGRCPGLALICALGAAEGNGVSGFIGSGLAHIDQPGDGGGDEGGAAFLEEGYGGLMRPESKRLSKRSDSTIRACHTRGYSVRRHGPNLPQGMSG